MVLEYVIGAAAIAVSLTVVFSCLRISQIFRKRNAWLSKDFFGIGFSFFLLISSTVAWFLTENSIMLYVIAAFSVAFSLSISYAVLRMMHPNSKRPRNWMILAYALPAFAYFLNPSPTIVPFALMFVSAAVAFASFALLFSLCKRIMRPYAIVGMTSQILAIVATYFTLFSRFPVSAIDNTLTPYFMFLAQTAFVFYGMYTIARYDPRHFLHHKER